MDRSKKTNRRSRANRAPKPPATQRTLPDGTRSVPGNRASIRKTGPTVTSKNVETVTKHLEKDLKKLKVSKRKGDADTVYLNGTRNSAQVTYEDIQNVIAFCQGVVFNMAGQYPDMFYSKSGLTNAGALMPTDVVAYFVSAIIGAYNKAGQLISTISSARVNFPADFFVPLPIAEYIRRRLSVVGAPNIVRRLIYNTDCTISRASFRYDSAATTTELGSTQFNTASGLQNMSCFLYTLQPGYTDDYTATYLPVAYNLFTSTTSPAVENWNESRADFVAKEIASLSNTFGMVKFSDIPLSSTGYSGFATPNAPLNWSTGKFAVCTSSKFDVYVACWLNPNNVGQKYPSATFSQPIPAPSFAVGGSAGNSSTGQAVGSMQVPISMTLVAQVTGTLNAILLQNRGLKSKMFGKNGYTWCNLQVNGIPHIVNVPIDVSQITFRMVRAFLLACQSTDNYAGLATTPGFIQGVYSCAEACVVSKVLQSGQLEKFITTSPNVPSLNWISQVQFPSVAYLQSVLHPCWAMYLANIGPVSSQGQLFVPTINLLPIAQQWSVAGGVGKYNMWSKFKFNVQGVVALGNYPPNMIDYTGTTPNLYRYPYFWGAVDPDPSSFSLWDSVNSVATTFCIPGQRQTAVSPTSQLASVLEAPQRYTYGATQQSSYFTLNGTNSGLEGTLMFQNLGAATIMETVLIALSFSGTAQYKPVRLSPQLMGSCAMLSQVFSRIPTGQDFDSEDPLVATVVTSVLGAITTVDNLVALGSAIGNSTLQSNTYLTNVRCRLGLTFPLVFQYVISEAEPATPLDDNSLAWVYDCDKSYLTGIWDEFALETVKEGSEFNEMMDKYDKVEHPRSSVEQVISTVRVAETTSEADAYAAALNHLVSNTNPTQVGAMKLEKVQEHFDWAVEFGMADQTVALASSLQKCVETTTTLEDFSAKAFASDVYKGLKTVIPPALKIGGALAALL